MEACLRIATRPPRVAVALLCALFALGARLNEEPPSGLMCCRRGRRTRPPSPRSDVVCPETVHVTSAHISLARAGHVVKPAVAAAGHTLTVEAWSIVLNYKAIGHAADVVHENVTKNREVGRGWREADRCCAGMCGPLRAHTGS